MTDVWLRWLWSDGFTAENEVGAKAPGQLKR